MQFSWRDPKAWSALYEAIPSRRGGPVEIARRMSVLFDSVTVYHASRPLDVQSYYEQGLRLADYASQAERAAEIFLGGRFPELSRAALNSAIAELSGFDDGRAYAALDKYGFTQYSGHYLIYGSEYLCAIAAHLGGPNRRDYRQVLKNYGTPTIFRINLPFAHIRESDAQELAVAVSHQLKSLRAGAALAEIDFSFRLDNPLPGVCVIGHEHPTQIVDPLQAMMVYRHVSSAAT